MFVGLADHVVLQKALDGPSRDFAASGMPVAFPPECSRAGIEKSEHVREFGATCTQRNGRAEASYDRSSPFSDIYRKFLHVGNVALRCRRIHLSRKTHR